MLAALASLGYIEVSDSLLKDATTDQPSIWSARFSGIVVPHCEVYVSTDAHENNFHIEVSEPNGSMRSFFHETSPFVTTKTPLDQDNRVPVIERLVRSFDCNDNEYVAVYNATNDLWKKTELYQDEFSG